jgi:hypothetical protein
MVCLPTGRLLLLVLATAVGAGGIGGAGCASKDHPTLSAGDRATTASAKPNPPPPVMADVDVRMDRLRQRASGLAAVAKQLPARTPQDDRKLTAQAFTAARDAVELLGGPAPGGAFRQQLRVIEDSTSTFRDRGGGGATTSHAASGSDVAAGLAAGPSIDAGLRSLEDALTHVREHQFPIDDRVRQQLDTLRDRVRDLDTARGGAHAAAVAEVFRAASALVSTMAERMQFRATNTPPAAAAAASGPPTQ